MTKELIINVPTSDFLIKNLEVEEIVFSDSTKTDNSDARWVKVKIRFKTPTRKNENYFLWATSFDRQTIRFVSEQQQQITKLLNKKWNFYLNMWPDKKFKNWIGEMPINFYLVDMKPSNQEE